MTLPEDDSNTPAQVHPAPGISFKQFSLYLLPFLVIPILLLGAAFFVVPTRWFALHSGNAYLANLGYATRLHNADCKVLIYGDSGALTNINPLTITAKTGLSACNIAEFEGMTAVNGTRMVDDFLRNNPRPEFMVFIYAPENLGIPEHWNTVSSFEAVTYRMGHYRNWETVRLTLEHPIDVLGWAEDGMRMTLTRIHSKPMGADKLDLRGPTHGFFHPHGKPLTQCDKIKHDLAPDPEWIDNLRKKYAVDGTTVIVDATPAAPCDASLPFILAHLPKSIDDLPYQTFPVTDYIQGNRLHMTDEGSARLTDLVIGQLLARMHAGTTGQAQNQITHGGS